MSNITVTLGEFVRREIPHLRVVSISQPEPRFARHNIVAVTSDVDAARKALLELEALEADDAKLGFVALSKSGEADVIDGRADPEGVTKMVASRILVGGAVGAIAGALLISGALALLDRGSTALIAAIGGAFFGGVFGATWVVFAGMGGSDAYRQSFIAADLTEACLVSLHTDDANEAGEALDRLAARPWITLMDVDADGTTMGTPARRPTRRVR